MARRSLTMVHGQQHIVYTCTQMLLGQRATEQYSDRIGFLAVGLQSGRQNNRAIKLVMNIDENIFRMPIYLMLKQ